MTGSAEKFPNILQEYSSPCVMSLISFPVSRELVHAIRRHYVKYTMVETL